MLTDLTGHELQVQVNPAFVRTSEIERLCGDPAKLLSCAGAALDFNLEDTLGWMLKNPALLNGISARV